MRKYGKKDSNHDAIRTALEQAGFSVQSLASQGDGTPDLLVGGSFAVLLSNPAFKVRGNLLLEVKNGELKRSLQRLTNDEVKWQAAWKGQVCTVTSVEEALRAVGAI